MAHDLSLGVALLAFVAAAAPVVGQGLPSLEAVSVHGAVDAGSPDVLLQLTYRLRLMPGGADLEFFAVPFFGLVPMEIDVLVDGTHSDLILAGGSGRALEGTVPSPAVSDGGETLDLELRYRVAQAVLRNGERLDIRLPLVLLRATPASSADDFFRAELSLPEGTTVTESFPVVPREVVPTASGDRYSIALQVVPAMLRWRATEGRAPLLSFDAAVDVALLLIIAVMAGFGAQALRRSA